MRPIRLFISYTHHDEPWCTSFVQALKRNHIDVWFDRDELGKGVVLAAAELQRVLSEALDGSDLIVMVYSSVSRDSPWVAWELMQRRECKRLVVLHNAPVGMVGAYVRYLANCGVYDAGRLPGVDAAEALLPHLSSIQQIAPDILQGLLKSDPRAEALWRLDAYKALVNPTQP